MSFPLIQPEEVPASDAQTILAFLNAAVTVQEIADRIELPNEPDVGPRLAANILARRAQLERFTSIDQLLSVKGIGPVRFTRIVTSLAGKIELVDKKEFDALAAQVAFLTGELDRLKTAAAQPAAPALTLGDIRPQDVPAAAAQLILDFLDHAQSADEIAARIELPHEPDVGPKIAAHIIERRTQLEGFTSLDQLLTVPLVGPVRFARIVRSFVPDIAVGFVDRGSFDDLAARVAALATGPAAAAAAGPRVVVRTVEQQRYLGQPLTVIATVTGPDGLRRNAAPVTLAASWGILRASDGFSVQQGASVTLRTAADGTVRATLLPPTSEDLEAPQQAAVEAMLSALDPSAATPRDAANGLATLVAAYRFDANDDLRAGVDIYFRDFHQHLVDRVNFRDELGSWATFDSTVTAYVQSYAADGSLDSGVQAAATLTFRFHDWLGAWLDTHVATAGADTLLGGDIALATNLGDPTDVLSRIHQHVGDFVSLQAGVAGQVVAQKVAQAKLDGFLETDIDALPEEHKAALFPAVDTSSTTVATLGISALGAIEQTRKNVDQQIQTAVPAAIEKSPAITGLQDAIATKVDITTLNDKLSKAEDFSSFKTSLLPVLKIQPFNPIFLHPPPANP